MRTGNDLADRPPLTARFKAALALQQRTIAQFARDHDLHRSQVWMVLSGDRKYPHILTAVAAVLGEREEDIAAEIEQARAGGSTASVASDDSEAA
jgi:hypothetical protein